MKRLAVSALVLLALSGCLSVASASNSAPSGASRALALEASILDALNRVRENRGLEPLARSASLRKAALGHSRQMASRGFFAHESIDGTDFSERLRMLYGDTGFARWTVGENLLYFSGTLDGTSAVGSWLSSPPHRRNVLDPAWREVGVGVTYAYSRAGVFGGRPAWVVTVDFGARSAR